MQQLQTIAGIGPKLAEKLIKQINNTDNVRAALRNSKLFNDLPIITRYDLQYNPCREIPYKVIARFEQTLKSRLTGIRHQICGSYRRGKSISSDIDIVVIAANWAAFQRAAKLSSPKIYASGEFKTSLLFKIPQFKPYVKLDIFYATRDNYIFMTLFATGSGQFNVFMRWKAQKAGYKLNQNGLYKNDKKINIKTLSALFDKLDMKYIPPKRRSSKYARAWA